MDVNPSYANFDLAPHTNLGSLFPEQRARIQSFRDAAADPFRIFGDKIGGGLRVGSSGRTLHSEESLRAAASALRLAILDGERACFFKVVGVLRLLQDPSVNSRLIQLQGAWRRLEFGMVHIHATNGDIGGKEIRDAWLFGRVTHHREEHRGTLVEPREWGELSEFSLQASIVGHSRLVPALDALCAEVLGLPPVWEQHRPGDEQFF